MKKILISAGLMMLPAMVQAEYIKAHDPHVVAPLDITCQSTPPPKPLSPDDVNNPDGYYDNALNKTGDELKASLNGIITAGHVKLPYSSSGILPEDVWTALEKTDEDPSNPDNVIYLYSGRSEPKASKAKNNQRHYWNREHVYPKANGGFKFTPKWPNKYDTPEGLKQTSYGYTDIHHLRPADAWLNTQRGVLEYDNGGNAITDTDTSKTAPELLAKYNKGFQQNKKDGDSFEPRDEVKGDVARMIFYMATRYEGADPLTPDLELSTTTIQADNGTAFGNICAMIQWHKNDPVDDFERTRNNRIKDIQGNRNPYIDNPDWADLVFAKEIATCK